MTQTLILLLVSFVVILAGCELFVNGIEWFGRRLELGEGAVGSVLAAVGTALPETIIPIIAILSGTEDAGDVGIGAILGAPFMLSTLAIFVCGTAVVGFSLSGRRTMSVRVNRGVMTRDLSFFLVVYFMAVLLGLIDVGSLRYLAAPLLIAAYGVYVWRTLKSEGDLEGETRRLYFHSAASSPQLGRIVLQIFVALSAIVFGADLFVEQLTDLAARLDVPPLLISLLLTPIATELPEKFNSVFWMRDRKDTLALGNITGAMVFQSAIPVAIGVLFTPWDLDGSSILAAGLALFSGFVLWLRVRSTGTMGVFSLLFGGLLYSTFLIYMLSTIL